MEAFYKITAYFSDEIKESLLTILNHYEEVRYLMILVYWGQTKKGDW
jgi:hypothetical protein